MGKRSRSRRRNGESNGAWSSSEHASHLQTKIDNITKKSEKKGGHDYLEKKFPNGIYRRSHLCRGSKENIESAKLKLHIIHIQKQVSDLRRRLTEWDDVYENDRREREKRDAAAAAAAAAAASGPTTKRRRVRPGPETWKLRGAARPAWEVYDFDTRYVCPHLKAHDDAAAKKKRLRNIFSIYRGRFAAEGDDDDDDDDGSVPPQPYCRNFLSLVSQLGHLYLEAKKYKSAREAFLECISLEGVVVSQSPTGARGQLMRLYLTSNRPASARRLYERIPQDDSVGMRYGAALVEYVSWKLLGEEGSGEEVAEGRLVAAVKANVFCGLQLAFGEVFDGVVEHVEELEDEAVGTVEEAMEYCGSEERMCWVETEGALEWVKGCIVKVVRGDGEVMGLTKEDLDWERKLKELPDVEMNRECEGDDDDLDNVDETTTDRQMYRVMFRTAMEMVEESGGFDVCSSNCEDDGDKIVICEAEGTDESVTTAESDEEQEEVMVKTT